MLANRHILQVLEQEVPEKVTADGKQVYPAGKLWQARAYTASRVRRRVEQVLDWAAFQGYRKGDNPARWDGNLEFALKKAAKTEHHPALPFGEVAAFLMALREREAITTLGHILIKGIPFLSEQ